MLCDLAPVLSVNCLGHTSTKKNVIYAKSMCEYKYRKLHVKIRFKGNYVHWCPVVTCVTVHVRDFIYSAMQM